MLELTFNKLIPLQTVHFYEPVMSETDRSRRRGDQPRGGSSQSSGHRDQSSGQRGHSSATQFHIPMLIFDPATGRNNYKEFKDAADMAAAAEFWRAD